MDKLSVIPPDRRDAARAALALVIDPGDIGAITPLKGGISGALILRVDTKRASFVLRIEPDRVAPRHRKRGFTGMEAAATVGVAPRLHHADPVTGIVVMDYVDTRPLDTHPGGRPGIVRDLATLLRRLQTTPLFPAMIGNDNDLIATLLHRLATSGMVIPGLLDRHHDHLAHLRTVLPWSPSALVSCHNDPNPRNLLSDGTRLWLVDWELAARNQPLFDVAIATLELADTPDLETTLLAAALGHPPDAADRARLRVTRLLARLFYGCIALDAVKAGQPPETSLDALTPAQFLTQARQGALPPDQIGLAFAKMSLAAFLDGCAAPGFTETLSLVRSA